MARLSDYFPRSIAERLYTPAMMRYDGTTGTYSRTYTSAGNKVTTVARFTCDSFTGGASRQLFNAYGDGASTKRRHQFAVISNDHATTTRRGRVYVGVNDSVGGQILQLVSKDRFDDGLPHTVFCSYDGDNGTTVFIVDGKDQLDTGNPEHILTTGTMSTGASSNIHMATVAAGGARWANDIGYFGHADAYLTNWQDFMDSHGHLKEISTSSWNGWGSQPLFWNPAGDMANNLGSAGDLNKIGTIEIASGVTYDTRDPQYRSGRMVYDGSTGYYNKTFTSSGNKVAFVAQFARNAFTGNTYEYPIYVNAPTGVRVACVVFSSDHTTRASKVQVDVQNSAATGIVKLISTMDVDDGLPHTVFFSFDADTAAFQFYVDGVAADDTGHASRVTPVTGTLSTGSTSCNVGSTNTPAFYWGGEIGYVGHSDNYLTNWADFMLSDGTPKALDEVGWTEWGSQPLFWNAHGDMVNNKGSAGAMTKNGTINVSDGAYRVRRLEPAYTPGMMEFDGTAGYYSKTGITTSGNKTSVVFRFSISNFTGTATQKTLCQVKAPSSRLRTSVAVRSSDWATADERGKILFFVNDSAGVTRCLLWSNASVLDGNVHTVLFSFDGDAGTATLVIDGVANDDTGVASRVAPTAGTLGTGLTDVTLGIDVSLTAGRYFPGDIGYFGYADTYLFNGSDFMEADGSPKQLNEITWPEWGAQPLFWNPHGDMTNNRGSAGDMTKNGTIDVSDGAYAETELVLDYRPAMMKYDGSTGYYKTTGVSVSGNKVTLVARFRLQDSAADNFEMLSSLWSVTNNAHRLSCFLFHSGWTADSRDGCVSVEVGNTSATTICALVSPATYLDGEEHTLFFSFDGDTGNATFIIDGQDADDTGNAWRTAPTTGTVAGGASVDQYVGVNSLLTKYFTDNLGFYGYADAYLTNWQDFMTAAGHPKALDESGWTEWGSQPLFWNEHGEMTNNLGSAGNMTKNGTIVVGKGGN